MPDTAPIVDIFARYGLRRVVNASGTETVKGASPVAPEVVAAVSELVQHSVEMAELQSVACHVIARAMGCEAGLVTNCTAAGIAMAIAGCMTGRDLALVEQLPDATGMKDEVILQKGHNVTYGGYIAQNALMVGARVIEIGAATECGAYQLRHAIGPRTAAALYVISHHTVRSGLIDLETFRAVCRDSGVPVIVDAAAEPDPRIFIAAGADLVIFSAHKQFASLTGGIVAGEKALVQACLYQEKGIGRPMKVGKEGVIAAIAALERWMALDSARLAGELQARLERAKARLDKLPGITAKLELDETSRAFSRLHLHVAPAEAGLTAFELSQALWNQTPSIFVRNLLADIGILLLDLRRVSDDTADWICDCVLEAVDKARAQGTKGRAPATAGPSPNLADLAVAGLERWPLPMKAPG